MEIWQGCRVIRACFEMPGAGAQREGLVELDVYFVDNMYLYICVYIGGIMVTNDGYKGVK